jgi:hypothetical protein
MYNRKSHAARETRRYARSAIQKTMRNAVPGLTIFVVKPDGVRWAKAFGLADIASRTSASEHTVYM